MKVYVVMMDEGSSWESDVSINSIWAIEEKAEKKKKELDKADKHRFVYYWVKGYEVEE